jgi:hypothetical protein
MRISPDYSDQLVPEKAEFAFRPDEAGESFRKVWADPIARLIWVAWKRKHMVDQYFDDECLTAAAYYRKNLERWLPRYRAGGVSNFYCASHEQFVAEILPVLRGERAITVSYPSRIGWMITEELRSDDRPKTTRSS